MAEVTIYTGFMCGFCERAKTLLARKKIVFEEINLARHPGARDVMIERANGQRTVPQIFIDGEHVGGSDELYALERSGRLDEMLGISEDAVLSDNNEDR